MIIHGTGILQHHFWGEYYATLVLRFDTQDMARLVLPKLVPNGFSKSWNIPTKNDKPIAGIFVNSSELDALVDHLVTLGAERKDITSVAKSIDHGESFGVIVHVEDPAQMQLDLQLALNSKPRRLRIAQWLAKHKGGKWTYDGSTTWRCDDGVRHLSRVAMDCMDEDGPVGYYLYGGSSPGWVHFAVNPTPQIHP